MSEETEVISSVYRDVGPYEDLAKLYEALAKARSEFGPVTKDRQGRSGNQTYMYATFENIQSATTPALSKHGLVVIQRMPSDGERACLVTEICHGSGAKLVSEMWFRPDSDIKGFGSQSTYFARYAYTRALCVDSGEDSDNNSEKQQSGTGSPQKPRQQRAPRKAATKPEAKDLVRPTAKEAEKVSESPKESPPEKAKKTAESPPEEVAQAEEPSEQDDPPITKETSKELGDLLKAHRVSAPACTAECMKIAKRSPAEFAKPGGERLGRLMIEHFTAKFAEEGAAK
jgi:hypothetical protein